MKRTMKNIRTLLITALMGIGAACVVSCSDDMHEENYYTFTGEMMSDYLQSHEDFSEFAAIVTKATGSTRGTNIMDLLSVRGQFTCFAPTNEAVDKYLAANGYKSVDEIPYDICDTIARTHLINGRVYNTADFSELLGDFTSADVNKVNMNDRYLSLEWAYDINEDGDTLVATYRLQGTGEIIAALANDSVENGIVHPVDAVLSSSNLAIPDLIAQNDKVKLFSEALTITGLANYMASKFEDESWNYDAEEYEAYHGKEIYSGAQWDWCDIPEKRRFKFTIFACPDEILERDYGITDLESFYNYARNIYGGPAYSADMDFTDITNPLHRLVAYQCLPFAQSYDHYTTICSIVTNATKVYVNPTEWYSTMDTLTTMKVTRLTSAREIAAYGGISGDMYLNRSDNNRSQVHNPGVHVNRPSGEYVQEARNGIYFLTDGLIDYGEDTKTDIFNTRIRFDIMDCFPEMISNDLRNYDETHNGISSRLPEAPARNYILPNGYLDGVKVNTDGVFMYQGARNWYWSYEGDEFNVYSDVNHYDIEFYLPSVPTGTYQLRLGCACMESRGICQFYLDDEPKGTPFDQRNNGIVDRIGWVNIESSSYTDEEKEAYKKNMHNLGWYHGPGGIFNTSGVGYKDGKDALAHSGGSFRSHTTTLRYVLCTEPLDERVRHKVRIKSVWAVGSALVMLDYLELVPKSVYGVEGEGKAEDEF